MSPQRLDNYLRSHRKQSGLSQDEVAFLLGCESGSLLSRYEKRRRLPPLETALACEAVFGVPIAELFAGVQQRTIRDVEKRRAELKTRVQAKDRRGSAAQMRAHKLRWLGADESEVGNQPILLS
jgi:transcriptional regulator with XRE-family HTH domain